MTQRPSPAGRLPFGQVLVALTGIYVSQTLVSGLTFQGIPTWLRAQEMPLDAIGLVMLAMLPWALKFLWAPAVERYRLPAGATRRRSRRIVVLGQAIVIAALVGVAAIGAGAPTPLLAVLIVAALAASTVDIACDAFAVEQLPPDRRGWGNTAQVGGSYLGAIFGSGLFLIVAAKFGWTVAATAMAGLVLVFSVPFWRAREPDRLAETDLSHRPSLLFALRCREVRSGLLVVVLFAFGGRIGMALAGPMLIDVGYDVAKVGLVLGMAGAVVGIVGTFIGGALLRYAGAGRAVAIALVVKAAALALLASAIASGLRDGSILAVLILFMTLAIAMGYVAVYSLLMSLSSPLQAGVDFTIFQSADALLAAVAGYGGSVLAQHHGYGASFGLAGAVAVAAACLVPPLLLRPLARQPEAVL
ncbi:MFS transporter [Enterovirga rhinocerotis]|uniref:MFS transporter (Putative signal transducer) n=1 Tax=Enterovirga rhinocerotis TaxID=1339210 RepID=A0A4R7CCW1_9HYPH|nr:MFS transporter [Enterovirga rhinocerotis]TDR95026.1 MFS transporter (putative signal transducer) [Enterovirga rhinocerotis]